MTVRESLRQRARPRFLRTGPGRIGAAIVFFVIAVTIFGPLLAPHGIAVTVGAPAMGPGPGAILGTDFIGRDVLSRMLNGGRSILLLTTISVLLTYLVGITIGLVAGYTRSLIDPMLMRLTDLILAFPALLLLLVLVAGAGTSSAVMVLGVTLVLFPGVVRIVRTAALEVSVKGFVEAAVARGESRIHIMFREILPNIQSFIIADFGIRFAGAVILLASLNFLGLGVRPPTADWALMVSENRQIISANVLSMLAPAAMLGLLTLGINFIGDSLARSTGRSNEDAS